MNISLFLFLIITLTHNVNSTEKKEYFEIDYEKLIALKNNKSLIGNKVRGKKIFASWKVNCLSCHKAPIKEEKFQGNFGPPLMSIGSIYNKNELRLRVINPKLINPNTIMPAYYEKIKYKRTPKDLLNKTILSAQEVEDLVEYLYSLK